jgi:hypothetical protein
MVKLTLVCLPVRLAGEEGTDRDKAINKRFEELKDRLDAIGVKIGQVRAE